MEKTIVNYSDIINGLKNLPLPENTVLLTHSSLKSFGYVEGGAQTVIKALIDTCGEKGTLVMPTLSFKSINESSPRFDVNDTPSDTGYITEVFRKMKGTKRSMHIFSSACAFGKNAEYIVESHYNTPCGPETPYGKVIELKGFVLFIGAKFQSNTLFHCAEEAVNPSYMKYKVIHNAQVTDYNGKITVKDYTRYDCYQTGISRKLERMEPIFRNKGVVFDTIIGNSHLMLISAEDNFNISCELLREDPDYILQK